MESQKYLDDISEIKTMMSRSSRFISLSGLSGIMAGIYALIGAALAHFRITSFHSIDYAESTGIALGRYQNHLVRDLGLIAITVIALAIITAVFLSSRKAKKSGEKLWNVSSKRLVINFFIPLIAGGIFCIVLLQYGILGLVSPATLIFYGLACVHASKYTLGDVRYLGLTNIVLGLVATQFIGYGLYFWAVGFGLLHIIYGISMYYKYDRK